MRRSVRDAIVGFTVLAGLVGFAATGMWMRGIRLGSSEWRLTANFNDASGLAERSPVTYRGRAARGNWTRSLGTCMAYDRPVVMLHANKLLHLLMEHL